MSETVAPGGERPFLVRLVSMTAGKDRHSPERAGYGSLPARRQTCVGCKAQEGGVCSESVARCERFDSVPGGETGSLKYWNCR